MDEWVAILTRRQKQNAGGRGMSQSTNALLTRNNDAKRDLSSLLGKILVEEEWKGGMWLCEVDGFAASG